MENKNNNNTKANTHNQNANEHTGRQGFASMPHDKVVEIASMGGHASHKNTNSKTEEDKTSGNQNKGSHTTSRSGK
jgi:general stress protein YciG